MKRILFSIVVIFSTLLIVSCVKDDEVEVADEPQVFNLDIAGMSDAQGSKLVWDSAGYLWWSESGDYVNINGCAFQVKYDNGWKAVAVDSTMLPTKDNNYYNICYMGSSTGNASWNSGDQLFDGVNFSGIVPLVGRGTTNNLTLYPCCAVLKCKMGSNTLATVSFTYADDETNKFSKKGKLNPETHLVESSTQNLTSISTGTLRHSDGSYFLVLPMTAESLTLKKISFKYKVNGVGSFVFKETGEGKTITIRKGVVYTIDGSGWGN